MTDSNEIDRIKQVYESRSIPDLKERGYLWHPCNPVSVYYRQAQERAIISLVNKYILQLEKINFLDVGCGTGNFLRFMLSLGAAPENLHGIDLTRFRIEYARKYSPMGLNLQVGNAMSLPFPDKSFEVVSQFTLFSSIFDPQVRARIAEEMVRVLKPNGFLLWYDLRRGKSSAVKGLSEHEVRILFKPCELLELRFLHPPYATRLAKRSVFLCEILDRIPGLSKTHCLALFTKI